MTRRFLLAAAAAASFAAASPATAQTLDVSPAAVDAAIAYVRGAAALGAAGEFAATGGHTSSASGATYVYVQQQVGGIDVDRAVVAVALDRQGRVAHVAGDVVAGAPAGAASPSLSAAAAAERAAAHVGISATPGVRTSEATADRATTLDPVAAGGDPTTARLVYSTPTGFPDGGALRLAWAVEVDVPAAVARWRVIVDAQSGAVLQASNLILSCTFCESPFEHAAHPAAPAPADRPLVLAPYTADAVGLVVGRAERAERGWSGRGEGFVVWPCTLPLPPVAGAGRDHVRIPVSGDLVAAGAAQPKPLGRVTHSYLRREHELNGADCRFEI